MNLLITAFTINMVQITWQATPHTLDPTHCLHDKHGNEIYEYKMNPDYMKPHYDELTSLPRDVINKNGDNFEERVDANCRQIEKNTKVMNLNSMKPYDELIRDVINKNGDTFEDRVDANCRQIEKNTKVMNLNSIKPYEEFMSVLRDVINKNDDTFQDRVNAKGRHKNRKNKKGQVFVPKKGYEKWVKQSLAEFKKQMSSNKTKLFFPVITAGLLLADAVAQTAITGVAVGAAVMGNIMHYIISACTYPLRLYKMAHSRNPIPAK